MENITLKTEQKEQTEQKERIELRKYNFAALQTVKKRCAMYKADGNTPVVHNRELYPMEKITNDNRFTGLFLCVEKREYDNNYMVYNDLGKICVLYEYIYGWYDVYTEMIDRIIVYINYKGLEGFKNYLSQMMEKSQWIRNTDILALADSGEASLAKVYRNYHDEQLKKREEENRKRALAYEEKQRIKEEERQAEIRRQVEKAIADLLAHKEIKNSDCDGKSIILYLIKKYGIKVPLKTQGWINNTLASLQVTNGWGVTYSYYRKKGCKDSNTAYIYLHELVDKLREEAAANKVANKEQNVQEEK